VATGAGADLVFAGVDAADGAAAGVIWAKLDWATATIAATQRKPARLDMRFPF
jgi:hypothetical protein